MNTAAKDALHTALLAHADTADHEHPAATAALYLLRLACDDQPASRTRGRDAGVALTEIRTVLSRARIARLRLTYPTEHERDENGKAVFDRATNSFVRFEDPDAAEMRAALDTVIALLERWERTGRARHSTDL